MEKQYTVKLTENQIGVLLLGLTMLEFHHRDTIEILGNTPEILELDPVFRNSISERWADIDTSKTVSALLCRAICGD